MNEQQETFITGENLQEISKSVLKIIVQTVQNTLAHESACVIGLSGGSTPKLLYSLLAKQLNKPIWKRVYFIQVDERWVDIQDKQSNAAMISVQLFNGEFPDNFIVLERCTTDAMTINNKKFNQLLQKFNKKQLDITILGMGTDGHTASLFPDIPNFGSKQWIQLVNKQPYVLHYVPSQEMKRISLTPKILQNTKTSIALITGNNKQLVLKNAIQTNNETLYPILIAKGQQHYWCTDFCI